MTLCLLSRAQFEQNESNGDASLSTSGDNGEYAKVKERLMEDKLSEAIPLAHRAAQILRDFRERYGLKISPAWLLQLQSVTSGVLVLDPQLADANIIVSLDATNDDRAIQNSRAAFDEVFRCLLGTGVEVIIARGVARMMYHTALDKKVALSHPTRSLLQIMSDTAWRPSDLSLLSNSNYPNFATTKGHENDERLNKLLSKWEEFEI